MERLRGLLRRRWIRGLALALILPLPAWILLCNVALWTGAVEALVTSDGKVTHMRLVHGRAWMLWPTIVHVRDAKFEIDSYSYQLAIEADEAVIDLDLWALVHRRVHMQRAEARGAWAQYRDKVDPEEDGDPDLAAYGPFDGTPPQVQSTTPKPVPPPGHEWGVDLDDIDVDLARAWIDEFDVEPCGHVRGAFHWVDAGELSVPTTTVELAGAGLWLGSHEALRGLDGVVTFGFAAFDSGEVEAAKTPGYLDFAAQIDGELVDPGAFAVWWPAVDGRLAGAPGPLEIFANADDGVLQPGLRIHHHSDHAELGPARVRLLGAPELLIDLDEAGRPRARAWLREASVHGLPGGELARSDALHGEVIVEHADMARPWSLAHARVETDEVRVDDLRRVSAAIGAREFQLRRGRARARAEAEMGADHVPHGGFNLHVEDGVLVAGSVEVGAALHSRGRITLTAEGELVAEDLELRSKGVTVKSNSGTSDGTWVRLHGGTVRYLDDRVTVTTRGTIEDARPAIVHLTRLDPFLRAVPDLQRIAPIDLRGKVDVHGELVEVELIDAEQLGLHVAALWRGRGEHWRLALLASGLTALGFTTRDGETLPRPVVLVGRKWYDERRRWVRGLARRRDVAID